jgi:DNA repair exonuclease SbcCD nuclease subunit
MNNYALIIGDPHFKISQFDTVKNCIKWVKDQVEIYKPKIVICLGDVFNDHANIRSELLKHYIDFVKSVCIDKNIKYIHIIGNHEFYKAGDKSYHALQAFKGVIDNFHIIDKPEIIEAPFKAMYIPYVTDFNDFPKEGADICFCHQSFLGADYGYIKDSTSMDIKDTSYKTVIAGHVHKRGVLNKVIFPGSLYAKDLRDIDEPKGLMLLNYDNMTYEYIESPFPLWKSLKLNLFDYKEDKNILDVINEKIDKKNIWTIELTGYKTEITSLVNSKEFKKIKENSNIKIKSKMLDSTKKSKTISLKNIDKSIDDFIDNIYEGNIDKNKIKEKMKKIKENIGE